MLKEQERIRRDRERELRLKARQDEEVRAAVCKVAWLCCCCLEVLTFVCHAKQRLTYLSELWAVQERMLMHAAQLRKKLGVMEPSREERYSKRIRNADDSSNPSPGEMHDGDDDKVAQL